MPKQYREQVAICMRCGVKGAARDLIHDGRNPALLVLKTCGCWDDKHKAEEPFKPKDTEGKARFPISPEVMPAEEIELIGEAGSGELAWFGDAWAPDAWEPGTWDVGGGATLSWTRPPMHGVRLERYDIWRSYNEGAFELLDSNEFVYSDFMEILNTPESYADDTATVAGTYRYYIDGVAGNDRRTRSNTLELVVV